MRCNKNAHVSSSQPGVEPGIFWSVVRRVIHCATGPKTTLLPIMMTLQAYTAGLHGTCSLCTEFFEYTKHYGRLSSSRTRLWKKKKEPGSEIGDSSEASPYVTVQRRATPADWREEPLPTPPPPAPEPWETVWLLRWNVPPSGGFFPALWLAASFRESRRGLREGKDGGDGGRWCRWKPRVQREGPELRPRNSWHTGGCGQAGVRAWTSASWMRGPNSGTARGRPVIPERQGWGGRSGWDQGGRNHLVLRGEKPRALERERRAGNFLGVCGHWTPKLEELSGKLKRGA